MNSTKLLPRNTYLFVTVSNIYVYIYLFIYLLQLGCHPVAVIILHVNKT